MTEPVSPAMKAIIIARLEQIEQEEDVRILFAIESGSRAWGFHSPDSDYDVRFVYARPLDWHFQLGKKRDVIERPIDDELDISGWELSKALGLAANSNAVIAEWLQSPIVYRSNQEAVAKLQGFAKYTLDQKSVTWHYVSLFARQAKRLSHPSGGIRIKRFFYILRPALALRWMRINQSGIPPMNLDLLRQGCALTPKVSIAIDDLLVLKMAAKEKGSVDAINPILSTLVEDELELAHAWLVDATPQPREQKWQKASRLHQLLSLKAFE